MLSHTCAILAVLACGLASITAQPTQNVVEIAQGTGNHGTLVTLVTSAGLGDTLSSATSNFTVFAPTDAAFQKIPEVAACLQLPGNVDLLSQLLQFHVVDGRVLSSSLTNQQVITPISQDSAFGADNNKYTFTATGNKLTASAESTITGADVLATNGVVHVIDTVLVPNGFVCRNNIVEVVANSASHSQLLNLVGAAGLADTLSGTSRLFTLFAPTNDAITDLPTAVLAKFTEGSDADKAMWLPLLGEILKFHVLAVDDNIMAAELPATPASQNTLNAGDSLMVSSAGITYGTGTAAVTAAVNAADLTAGNGVVHSIDKVLLPSEATRTVVDIASGSNDHTKLVNLLTTAELVDTLSAVDGAFTVFAPTNAALDEVDAATMTCLEDAANKDLLVELLKYHVHGGVVLAAGLPDSVPTLAAGTYFTASAPKADISTTTTGTDLLASNGVLHIVDKVLIPAGFACPGVKVTTSSASAFSASSIMVAGFLVAVAAVQARF